MSAIKAAVLDALPAPDEVQLYADAEQIAEALHETQTRIAAERGQLAGSTPWAKLPCTVRFARVDAVAELLQRGLIAGPDTHTPTITRSDIPAVGAEEANPQVRGLAPGG